MLKVGGMTSSSGGGGGVGGAAEGGRFGNDAESSASGWCEGAGVDIIEALSGFAFPFAKCGSSPLSMDPSLEHTNIDSRSEGAALKLLPLAGATLLTILGPNTRGFRSSFTPPTGTTPFPTVASEAVDKFASAIRPTVSGFKVSSELRGETFSGYIPGRACTTRS
jgi:hypothetical protein